MYSAQRKTNPRVMGGVVQKKNNASSTGDYYREALTQWKFEKQRPRPGFQHVVGKKDLDRFIEIIPGFDELSVGLDAIVLAQGRHGNFGVYRHGWTENGFILLQAWTLELDLPMSKEFYEMSSELIDRLNIPYEQGDSESWPWRTYRFTHEAAKAFMLLDVFLHELGHHHDRVSSKRKKKCGRGEAYAEEFARDVGRQIWPEYIKRFDV